jgi:DNA-binding MarR family transcriptional regulator
MQDDVDQTPDGGGGGGAVAVAPGRLPLIRLLSLGMAQFSEELHRRYGVAGFGDIRPGHGCVFGNIDPEGTRLTDMAERARMTKQSVGEMVTDLERRGYLERVPDPTDGRVKIIRLTDGGREAQRVGRQLIDQVERDWAERYGEDRVAALRAALEAIAAGGPSRIPA